MKTFDEHVEDAAMAAYGAWQFGGSERRAIRDYLKDEGFTIGYPEAERVSDCAMRRCFEMVETARRAAGVI